MVSSLRSLTHSRWLLVVAILLVFALSGYVGSNHMAAMQDIQTFCEKGIQSGSLAPSLTQPMCSGPTTQFPQTGCVADFTYVNMWAQFRPLTFKSWTFVNVGANKGYTIVAVLQAIGITKYTPMGNHDKLVSFASKEGMSSNALCGACNDCKNIFKPYGTRHIRKVLPTAQVYAFDPLRAHAKYLKETFKSDDSIAFTVRQMALSNQSGVGPVSTLTKELRGEGINFIDVLLTDTEGNDFKVAEGAAEWIFAGKVGLYIFEIHRDNEMNLGTHIRRLESAGYRCFAPMRGGGAVQISHDCWNPDWETVAGRSNIICANERLPHLMEAMYSISTYSRTCAHIAGFN